MADFSLTGYRAILSTFREAGYQFCGYDEIEDRLAEEQPFVVLRHDIDISLRPALEVARLEHEQGIQATYFVSLRSPFYNPLNRLDAERICQLHRYGHQVALHVDLLPYEGDCASALVEISILLNFYPFINPGLAALHSPNTLDARTIEQYPPLQNTYGATMRGDVAYISDSTGQWLFGHPLASEAFSQRKPIQLLTHPIWWVQPGRTPREKLEDWFHEESLNATEVARAFLPKLFRRGELEQLAQG